MVLDGSGWLLDGFGWFWIAFGWFWLVLDGFGMVWDAAAAAAAGIFQRTRARDESDEKVYKSHQNIYIKIDAVDPQAAADNPPPPPGHNG